MTTGFASFDGGPGIGRGRNSRRQDGDRDNYGEQKLVQGTVTGEDVAMVKTAAWFGRLLTYPYAVLLLLLFCAYSLNFFFWLKLSAIVSKICSLLAVYHFISAEIGHISAEIR